MSVASNKYTEGEYLASVPEWHANDAPWKAGKVIELLQRNDLTPVTVCDVGCGAGEILVHLQQHLGTDADLHGYDISPQAIAICKPKENDRLSFHERDLLQESHERFDLLLLLDVFEHVQDYLDFLARLRDRAQSYVFHIPLDMNAMSVILGSRYMLFMRKKYGHLHYFSCETAIATLEDVGFEIVDYFFTWDGDLERPQWRDFLKHPLRSVWRVSERMAFRVAPRIMACLRPNYNIMVLAERREEVEPR
jgi:SAM-dependent methyltransferase